VLPSYDRRLIRLQKLLNRHASILRLENIHAKTNGQLKTFYLYLADILPDHFGAVEYTDPARREEMERSLDRLTN
jgi:hypothetical protein